jgi:hypothetical protein
MVTISVAVPKEHVQAVIDILEPIIVWNTALTDDGTFKFECSTHDALRFFQQVAELDF